MTSNPSTLIFKEPALLVKPPEPYGWQCEAFGMGGALVFHPKKGAEPNWFWRQMQYLCFGNKWRKVK